MNSERLRELLKDPVFAAEYKKRIEAHRALNPNDGGSSLFWDFGCQLQDHCSKLTPDWNNRFDPARLVARMVIEEVFQKTEEPRENIQIVADLTINTASSIKAGMWLISVHWRVRYTDNYAEYAINDGRVYSAFSDDIIDFSMMRYQP